MLENSKPQVVYVDNNQEQQAKTSEYIPDDIPYIEE
jgi:hypothetical protein